MNYIMIKVEYQGAGAFFHGIPARGLTPDEWEALSEENQTLLKNSDVYNVLSKPKKVEIEVTNELVEKPNDDDVATDSTVGSDDKKDGD